MEAAARRGEMELAISKGVVPLGTSRTDPSGRCTAMFSLLIVLKFPRPRMQAFF